MKGNESSTVYVSDENLLIIRPVGVTSKNFMFAYNKNINESYKTVVLIYNKIYIEIM